MRWVAQAGFVENINSILREYKQSRKLLVTTTILYFNSGYNSLNESIAFLKCPNF